MFSAKELRVIDAVARGGSFSAAATELHKVPSAISYTVKTIEERLAVTLFVRQHRDVIPTPAGEFFVTRARELLNEMAQLKEDTQRVANGWTQHLYVALDTVVSESRMHKMVHDFYNAFSDVELHLNMEVFNGVWDALADNRADLVIGATAAIPVGGNFAFRDMGILSWAFVVSATHPLTQQTRPLSDDHVRSYPSICLEDTSRHLPKRITWQLDNQRRILVPSWHDVVESLKLGLGVAMVPYHMVEKELESGELVSLAIESALPISPCCVAWNTERLSPAMQWLLDYLGDSDTLNSEWLVR
uniref:DNA-binding transcriptional activator PunR n=1 Tax=Thaumasiovibrio occultus TaxID=1891184 RepID=UPI000B357832|nr:DNA-binding transcriptional activator PunR [Thaumasiovibrio occultus]